MITRNEIMAELAEKTERFNNSQMPLFIDTAILEVLLDIRELQAAMNRRLSGLGSITLQ